MKGAPGQLIIVTLAICAAIPAAAGVIHKWVDADGVTHYSDAAPAVDDIPVTVIEVAPTHSASGDSTAGYYSIASQWERMRRERIEREKLALERARLEAEWPAASTTPVSVGEAPTSRTVTALPVHLYPVTRYHRMHRRNGHRYRRAHVGPGRARSRQQADLGYFPHVD